MKRVSAHAVVILIGLATAVPAAAGPIDLCNASSNKFRSAVIIKDGFAYLSDKWSNIGYYYLEKGECRRIGGGSWGGTRAWGFISIETEKSAKELEYLRTLEQVDFEAKALKKKFAEIRVIMDRKREAMRAFSAYDHLVKYLPGSSQRLAISTFDAEIAEASQRPLPPTPEFDVETWEFTKMQEQQDVIDNQGFSGSTFETCLPKTNFDYSTNGQPSAQSTCADSERLVKFALEVWVLPGSSLVLNVGDTSVESSLRH